MIRDIFALGVMFVIFDYIFTLLFWGLTLGLGWLTWKTWRKKWFLWMPLFAALTALLLWIGLVIGFVPGAGIYHRAQITRDLFGTSFLLWAPSLSYDSERHFNGDGYSLTVYSLSESQVKYIQALAPDNLSRYPTDLAYRSKWTRVSWQQSPMKVDEHKYFKFCQEGSYYAPEPDKTKAMELMTHIEKALAAPGCFYSYNYQMGSEEMAWLTDIDFFFVDPQRRLLVLINNQT